MNILSDLTETTIFKDLSIYESRKVSIEQKTIVNEKELITKHEKLIEILEAIKYFKSQRISIIESINGVAGSLPTLRAKYINRVDTIDRAIERLYSRYQKLNKNN